MKTTRSITIHVSIPDEAFPFFVSVMAQAAVPFEGIVSDAPDGWEVAKSCVLGATCAVCGTEVAPRGVPSPPMLYKSVPDVIAHRRCVVNAAALQ